MAKTTKNSADYIVPLNINDLEGRMLHIPASSKRHNREILFVYGHHSSLERWWGVMEILSRYGTVTMPDLPGFGGMDSFYKLGEKPTIDNMADYLAAFIKWRYKRKKVVIAGMSFGFIVVTRMLQRYPELTKRVDMVISLAGFAHRDDFIIPKPLYYLYRTVAKLMSYRLTALLFYHIALNPLVLRTIYTLTNNEKFRGADKQEFKHLLGMEVHLWRINDVRTAMSTLAEFFVVDNCKQQVHVPVYHVGIDGDRYFDNHIVEQHLRVISDDFHLLANLAVGNHAPSVIATAEEAAPFVPPKLRRLLAKL